MAIDTCFFQVADQMREKETSIQLDASSALCLSESCVSLMRSMRPGRTERITCISKNTFDHIIRDELEKIISKNEIIKNNEDGSKTFILGHVFVSAMHCLSKWQIQGFYTSICSHGYDGIEVEITPITSVGYVDDIVSMKTTDIISMVLTKFSLI